MKLSPEEINRRLIRLRNLERLYVVARTRISFLEKENRRLRQRIKDLEARDKDKDIKLQAMAFQLEQITIKLFGKKPVVRSVKERKESKVRDIDSYRRPIPSVITTTKVHPVSTCQHCHQSFTNTRTHIFYEEDIPLPLKKTVIKHTVEVGYCTECRKQTSGYFIPTKTVILGEKVRKYISVLAIANRLPHSQIQSHLTDIFSLSISLGEIGNILQTEADRLRPEYEALKQSVQNQTGTHYDESSWPVQKEDQGKFVWVATGTETNDTVFSAGRSRGKGNIGHIGTNRVGITDDYGAYRTPFNAHQLCWAHPLRKLRDIVQSQTIPDKLIRSTVVTYQRFADLYTQIRKRLGQSFSVYLKQKWRRLFDEVTSSSGRDPVCLTKLKAALTRNKERYFTFLQYPGIPIDNNKAERALRHLVIKRKISFGSKTQRGAETLSILASVVLSLKWNHPQDWFGKYLVMRP